MGLLWLLYVGSGGLSDSFVTFLWLKVAFLLITFLSFHTRAHAHKGEANSPLL